MAGSIDLYADLDALQQLASRLTQIKDALDHAKDDVESYAPSLGSARVSHSLHEFVDGWKDGRKAITGNIDKLSEKVQGVAQTYQEQEDTLAKQSAGSGQSSPGSSTGPH
jgi:ABC-type transporter Mla subunit MlaD